MTKLKLFQFLFPFAFTLFCIPGWSQDAMQEIQQKAAEVRTALQEIQSIATRNGGTLIPDADLERAIARFETAITSLDYALVASPRLPPCERAPSIDTTQALTALQSIVNDNVPDDADMLKEINELIARKFILQRVQTTSKNILKLKLNASLFSLGLTLIPLPGKGAWDFMNIMDGVLTRINRNPSDPTTRPGGMKFAGVTEYRQFMNEPQNREKFNQFASEQAGKMGYVHRLGNTVDTKKVTEYDVALWGNVFTLTETRQELTRIDQRLAQLKGAPLQSKQNRARAKKQYLEGLVNRFSGAYQNYAWITDPSSLERMLGSIRVTVLEDAGGPLLQPTVALSPGGAAGQEDAPNVILFEGLQMGSYSVTASKAGYVSESAGVELKDCKPLAHVFKLKKNPVIKVVDIKDAQGRLIDDIQVDVIDIAGGTTVGGKKYQRVPLLFAIKNPGAFTVIATDSANLYESESQNVNAEAGAETEVHLVMKQKSGPELVFEINDALSGKRIDPAPGSQDPGVSLNPDEGQPAPSRKAYLGKGEVIFTQVGAGRYKYHASLCGWESASGSITISADELKTKRIVRPVSLKPRTLRSFTGNVIEEGTTEHVSGFKASLRGLGPRDGYRYDTEEGKHPDPSVVGSHFGAFVIPGPIYSGHYELQITLACYLPIRSDQWWNFCLADSSYTPQIFNLKPTPEFLQAQNQTRSLIKKINDDRDAAKQAADAVAKARRSAQGISDLAAGLSRDLQALKQQHASLEKACADAATDLKSIQTDSAALDAAANQIIVLRETAKNLAGVACEMSEKAQSQQDPVKASNLAINAQKFADQTRKKAEEAKTVAQNAQQNATSLAQKMQKVQQVAEKAESFRKAFAAVKSRLAELRAQANQMSQATGAVTNATAALTRASGYLASIRQLLLSCASTNTAKSLQAQADTAYKGVAGEKKRAEDENKLLQDLLTASGPVITQVENLGSELERIETACNPFQDFQDNRADAKATADTIDLYAQGAQESVTEATDCAQRAARSGAGTQTANQIQELMQKCDFPKALTMAAQLQKEDPDHSWLAQNLGKLQQVAATMQQLQSALTKAAGWMAGVCPADLSGISSNLQAAEQLHAQLRKQWPACEVSNQAQSMAEIRSFIANCQQSTPIIQGVEEIPEDGTGSIGVEEIPEDTGNPVGQKKEPATGPRWVQQSVTQHPPTPSKEWSVSSGSASYQIYNGDRANFSWTPPPQQFDGNGFTMSLSAQGNPANPAGRIAALISVGGSSGFQSGNKSEDLSAYAASDSGAASASKSVTFKPNTHSSEIEIEVSIQWGAVSFTYKYKRAE